MLNQEYKRFLYVNKIKNFKHRNMHEYLNALDGLFIDMANMPNNKDKVFIDLPKTHPLWVQFSKRMKDKKLDDRSESIRKLIYQYLNDNKVYNVRISKAGNTFTCNRFKFELPDFRIKALEKRGTLEEIVTMILRYQCIVARGNHWNDPLAFHKYIYEHEGVRLEGFSSPLNSQLMLVGDDVNFCSLFPDTDKVFGSVGSFFDLKEPEAISFDPPHSEELINEGIKKTLSWKKTRVYYNLPCWTDMEGYDMLDVHKDVSKKIFEPGEFYYEHMGTKIMFKGKHLMYTLRAKNPEAVFDTLRPTEEMKKEFEEKGRLINF